MIKEVIGLLKLRTMDESGYGGGDDGGGGGGGDGDNGYVSF